MPTLLTLALLGSSASCLANAAPIGNSSDLHNPHRMVGWEPNPNRRGSLNIIQSCAFTILACTWSIQRLNVPRYNDTGGRFFIRRFVWFIAAILAPEFTLAHAIEHRRWVRECIRDLEEKDFWVDQETYLYPWKWPKLFRQWWSIGWADKSRNKLTLKHCYFGNMGGFVVFPKMDHLSHHEENGGKPVTFQELMDCLQPEFQQDATPSTAERTERLVKRLGLTEEDIEDRDKVNLFATTITVLQLLWLGLSLLTRVIRNIASTQLEIVTLAFAACAFITYLINWDKPQHVRISQKVVVEDTSNNINTLVPPKHPLRFSDIIQGRHEPTSARGARLRNDTVRSTQDFPLDMLTLLTGSMVLIGALHLLAWNFSFPTHTESACWRAAALASTIAPVVPLFLFYPIPFFFSNISHIWYFWLRWGRTLKDAREFAYTLRGAMSRFVDEQSLEGDLSDRDLEVIKYTMDVFEDPRANLLLYRHLLRELKVTESHVKGEEKVSLLWKLERFITDSDEFPPSFVENFNRLSELIQGLKNEELIPRADTTFDPFGQVDSALTFPALSFIERFHWYRKWMMGKFSIPVMLLYMAARLMIMALALSSFRAMPDSVYWTTWTRYMPLLE